MTLSIDNFENDIHYSHSMENFWIAFNVTNMWLIAHLKIVILNYILRIVCLRYDAYFMSVCWTLYSISFLLAFDEKFLVLVLFLFTCSIPFANRSCWISMWISWLFLSCVISLSVHRLIWLKYAAFHMQLSLRALMLCQTKNQIDFKFRLYYLLDFVGIRYGPVICPNEWHFMIQTKRAVVIRRKLLYHIAIHLLWLLLMHFSCEIAFIYTFTFTSMLRMVARSVFNRLSHYCSLMITDLNFYVTVDNLSHFRPHLFPTCRIGLIETGTLSISQIIRNWNVNIHQCLKNSIYIPYVKRVNSNVVKARLLIVIMVIGLHGLQRLNLIFAFIAFHLLAIIEKSRTFGSRFWSFFSLLCLWFVTSLYDLTEEY